MVSATRTRLIVTRVALILFFAVAVFDDRVPTQSSTLPQHGIRDLGTLGGATSAVLDVSEFGQSFAGRAQTASGAFHAFSDGYFGRRDLGTLGGAQSTAHAVHYGFVAGQAQTATGAERAFLVDAWGAGAMQNLGTLGGNWSAAFGVESGQVVGASQTAGNARLQAFSYSNGVMSALPVNRGGDSAANAIVGDSIVGYSCTAGNASCTAFAFQSGVVTYLGSLGGNSSANNVNYNGQIVGVSALRGGSPRHAFLYESGAMRDLGTLGGANSEALDINTRGAVVGTSDIAGGGTHAFVWVDGVMTDLNSVLPAGSGWVLQTATGITDAGQIVGTGTRNGVMRGFLLTPPMDLRVLEHSSSTNEVSNLPRGVEAGRNIRFFLSVVGTPDPLTLYGVRLTETLTGPAEFVSIQAINGTTSGCQLSAKTLTCDVPPVDTIGFGREYMVIVRTTGAGTISHRPEVTIDVPDTNPSNNSYTEGNYAVSVSSLTLTPATLPGGKASSARVTLTGIAPGGDAVVRLSSSNPAVAPVPATVIVPFPNTTRAFNIIPRTVAQPTSVVITATYGLVTVRQTLTVVPPALQQLYLTPTTIVGGCGTSAGKILLTGHAPPGGAVVPLSNTNSMATVPATVTVAEGTSSKTFTVTTKTVTTNHTGTVSASYGGVSQALTVHVRPIRVKTLVLTPNPVTGGGTATATLTLECAAPSGGILVSLSSSNAAVASPTVSSILIPAGATTGAFTVRTARVTASTNVTIYATAYGVRKGATLTVRP